MLDHFESTTTAPLWMFGGLPFWFERGGDERDGELDEDLPHLQNVLNQTIKDQENIGEEWLGEKGERGCLFSTFAFLLNYRVHVRARPFMEWVDQWLTFARNGTAREKDARKDNRRARDS